MTRSPQASESIPTTQPLHDDLLGYPGTKLRDTNCYPSLRQRDLIVLQKSWHIGHRCGLYVVYAAGSLQDHIKLTRSSLSKTCHSLPSSSAKKQKLLSPIFPLQSSILRSVEVLGEKGWTSDNGWHCMLRTGHTPRSRYVTYFSYQYLSLRPLRKLAPFPPSQVYATYAQILRPAAHAGSRSAAECGSDSVTVYASTVRSFRLGIRSTHPFSSCFRDIKMKTARSRCAHRYSVWLR